MKTVLKILIIIVLGLVILMFALGKSYHFEKSIVIDAPVEKIYSQISSSKTSNHS